VWWCEVSSPREQVVRLNLSTKATKQMG
jgi:hypothetical protein